MYTPYKPPPARPIELSGEPVQVPDILERPEPEKKPIIARIMMFLMPVLVIGMLAWFISSGMLAQNPMMIMMPLMMIMMMGMMFSGGAGNVTGEMATKIRHWLLDLRERRKQVHKQAKMMFQAQRTYFPQPQVLHSLVGQRPFGERHSVPVPRMWVIGRGKDAGLKVEDQGAAAGITYNPYMSARIGLGTTLLDPRVEVNEQQVQENLEPVTYEAWRRFMRLNRFITDMPIAFDLKKSPYYQLDGDYEPTLALTRAMLANLTFNHPPTELAVVLITDDPDDERWSAVKWLPHVQERKAQANGDVRRMIYRSLTEFWSASAEMRADRGMFMTGVTAAAAKSGTSVPQKVLVVVDVPDSDNPDLLPHELDARGVGEMTFLWIGRAPTRLGVAEESTLYLDQAPSMRRRKTTGDAVTMISTGVDPNIARADAMTVAEFRVFARALSGYRPFGWKSGASDVVASTTTEKVQTFLEALGITGAIEDWDPVIGWKKRDHDRHTVALVGNELDDDGHKTSTLIELDLAEAAAGGTGPSGAAQGTTGSGKSYLLRGLVGSLASRYSPERLNFLLMDFKGGSTWIGYERLPHVQAVVTNLEEERHLLARMQKVIRGEIERRQRLITKVAKAVDIDEYRTLREAKPELDLPALPNLMVVADEFREFIENNREYMKLFESVAQVGRSLGMHLLLVSQFIDEGIIGAVKKNLTYGISLAVEDQSNSMAVIKSPAAADLPIGTGDAYLWRKVPHNDLVKLRSFDVAARYSPPARPSSAETAKGSGRGGFAAVRMAMQAADGSAVVPFDATNTLDDDRLPAVLNQQTAATPESEPGEVVSGYDDRPTMERVLVERLAAIQSIPAPHRMWLPTLSRPLPFTEVAGRLRERSLAEQMAELQLTIGMLDDPARHRQALYTLVLDGAGAHVRIAGDRGTGVSTTIQAMIVAAATQVGAAGVQFYILDAGNKLSEMAQFPNVGAYSRATTHADDQERIDRILGEFLRVIEIRQSAMQERGVSSFGGYWQSKQESPVPADPYGRMVLVIDHVNTFFAEDDDNKTRQERVIPILTKGAGVGMHVVVGSSAETMNYKVDPKFSSIIHHRIMDLTQGSIAYPEHELKSDAKLIPAEPGRVLDLSSQLQGRIMMPHTQSWDPDPELTTSETNPKWNYKFDWRPQIEALGGEIGQANPERAPQIVTVDKVLAIETVWSLYQQHVAAVPGSKHMVPLGVSAEDLTLVGLPDPASDPTVSANLIVAGDRGTAGKTTVMRWLLRWIASTYKAGEAVVYLIDTSYQLMTERDRLNELGLLGSYTANRNSITPMVSQIQQIVESRLPTNPDEMTAKQLRERSWWSGPELFIVADPGSQLISGGGGYGAAPGDELARLVSERNDLGARLWMTLPANELQSAVQSGRAVVSHLIAGNANVLMMSGSVTGTVFGQLGSQASARFERRRPGLGQLYNPQKIHYPLVQIPNDHSWE